MTPRDYIELNDQNLLNQMEDAWRKVQQSVVDPTLSLDETLQQFDRVMKQVDASINKPNNTNG